MAIGTTIDGLNAVTSLTAQDEVPVWDVEASGEPTKKITASNLASSVKSLASLPNTTEMNTAISQSTALHVPSNWTEAVTNGTLIIVVAKGIVDGNKIALTISIPVASLEDDTRYYMVSDAYNTGSQRHFQVNASKTSYGAALFDGATGVAGATFSVYYL